VYYNYLQHLFGSKITQYQTLAIVGGVGHSSTDMFASACGKYFIFDYGECGATQVAAYELKRPGFSLLRNYPNPFNPVSTLSFSLSASEPAWLTIYNVLGERLAELLDGKLVAVGEHKVRWDAQGFPAGIYFARLRTKSGIDSISRIVLLK